MWLIAQTMILDGQLMLSDYSVTRRSTNQHKKVSISVAQFVRFLTRS